MTTLELPLGDTVPVKVKETPRQEKARKAKEDKRKEREARERGKEARKLVVEIAERFPNSDALKNMFRVDPEAFMVAAIKQAANGKATDPYVGVDTIAYPTWRIEMLLKDGIL